MIRIVMVGLSIWLSVCPYVTVKNGQVINQIPAHVATVTVRDSRITVTAR